MKNNVGVTVLGWVALVLVLSLGCGTLVALVYVFSPAATIGDPPPAPTPTHTSALGDEEIVRIRAVVMNWRLANQVVYQHELHDVGD